MTKIILGIGSAKHLDLQFGGLSIGRFPDGEISMVLEEPVEGREVVLIGSTQPSAENLFELLLAIDLVNRKGAAKITCIIPYLGYAKSDREKVLLVLACHHSQHKPLFVTTVNLLRDAW